MDSLSQIVLGASVGEFILGRKIGNKALLWGAVAGTIPDLDVLIVPFFSVVNGTLIHRGFSHSLLFCFLGAWPLGYLLKRMNARLMVSGYEWSLLVFWCFLTHILLDCFTTWGTQIFWPLEQRVAWNSVFVIDPLYTMPFLLLLVALAFVQREKSLRRKLNFAALVLSSGYLILGLLFKHMVNQSFESAFAEQNMKVLRYTSRPAPLNTILWTVNAEMSDSFALGYYSLLDNDNTITFVQVPKNHDLLDGIDTQEEIIKLKQITEGYYTVDKKPGGYVMNDLRFGQMLLLDPGNDTFVFRYEIERNRLGKIEINRPSPNPPKSWSEMKKVLGLLYKRILGNK